MYTKNTFRNDDTIIIPENYNGNAFTEKSVLNDTLTETLQIKKSEDEHTAKQESSTEENQTEASPSNTFISSLFPPKVSNSGGILNNIGLEELIILGVLVLLYQSDADNDILLMLFLLLFYK